MKKPIILAIMDGLGYDKNKDANAWKLANTPTLDDLVNNYPNSVLKASGSAVGLPEGQMGNSEVGHLNIGAGQIVYTGLPLIQRAIDDKSFFSNKAFLKSIDHAKKNNSTIHVMGLLSSGGVHSLDEHLYAILKLLHDNEVKNVTVHAFTDGRDVPSRSVKKYLVKLIKVLKDYKYNLGSICGRLYAMDRDKVFSKTEIAYEALRGHAENKFTDPFAYIDYQYNDKNLSDEFIECGINKDSEVKFLQDGDSVIFFNFRPDRARQLSHLIVGSDLYDEKPKNELKNIQMSIMMPYEGIKNADVAFQAMEVNNPIGKILAEASKKQLRIAETQKYAHVTFFMDGGKDIKYPLEDRILIDSAKVDNFAEKPEMSAQGITDALIKVIDKYDVVILNYANPDMVGHTGNLKAAIKAVEVVDHELARLKAKVDEIGGTMFITADHGNAEIMKDKEGNVVTKHTTSDVPFISTDKSLKLNNGSLCNIAPTILDYIDIKKGESMDHDSLIK